MIYKSRGKLGEQRKILGVKFTNICENLPDHQKLSLVHEKMSLFGNIFIMWELSM